jgi:hypothetical protein
MRGRWERGEQWYQRGLGGPRRLVVAVASDVFVSTHSTGARFFSLNRTYRLECGHETGLSGGGCERDVLALVRRKLGKRPRCSTCQRAGNNAAMMVVPITCSSPLQWRFAEETFIEYPRAIAKKQAEFFPDDILIESFTAIHEAGCEMIVHHFVMPDAARLEACRDVLV